MNPPKFTVIPFQQPNTCQCPACGFTSGVGPAVVFATAASPAGDALQLVCARCSYGGSLEWLMATAT